MGVGLRLPGWTLQDQAGAHLVVDASAVSDSVRSGVVQRVFALGQQRSFAGFASRQARSLTVEDLTPEQRDWITARIGQLVTVRDTSGGIAEYILGDFSYSLQSSDVEADGGNVETVHAYGASLQLFYSAEVN